MSGGSNFVTKEFVIPESPEGSPPPPSHLGGRRRPMSSYSGERSSGSRTREGGAPPPAIPDALFDALSREPPPSNNYPRSESPSAQSSRRSFGFSRPTTTLTKDASRSRGLPALPTVSPLGFNYPSSSKYAPSLVSSDDTYEPAPPLARQLSRSSQDPSLNESSRKASLRKKGSSEYEYLVDTVGGGSNYGLKKKPSIRRSGSLRSRTPKSMGDAPAQTSPIPNSRAQFNGNGITLGWHRGVSVSSSVGSEELREERKSRRSWDKSEERYTRELEAHDSDGEGDDSMGEGLGIGPPGASRDSLYSRRRNGASGRSPKVSVDPYATEAGGLQTAPLFPSNITPTTSLHPHLDSLRNRSQSEGDVSLMQGALPDSPKPIIEPRVSTAEFVIAIIGPRNVGKSTVVRAALKRHSTKSSTLSEDAKGNRVTLHSSKLQLGGRMRSVEVLEIDMAVLRYNDNEGVIWPPELPPIEGALICYDATDARSLEYLALLLQSFWTRGSGVPILTLACKSQPDASLDACDCIKASEISRIYDARMVTLDGGLADPGKKMKASFAWMFRAIMRERGEDQRASSAMTSSTADGSRQSTQSEAMSRSDSHNSGAAHVRTNSNGSDPTITLDHPSMIRSRGVREDMIALSVRDEALPSPPRDDVDSPANHQYVDATSSSPPKEPIPREGSPKNEPRVKTSALDLHFSREDMIDKFLFASVTGNDDAYVTLFLIVYRRFARPYDVLTKLIERFEFVAGRLGTDPLLSRFAQMKLCGVLSTWCQTYPGDFSAASTFAVLQSFLDGLLPRGATWVAHYAIELLPLLRGLSSTIDPEAAWALPDKTLLEVAPAHTGSQSRRPSLVPSFESTSSMSPSNLFDLADGANASRLSVPATYESSPMLDGDRLSRPGSDGTHGTGESLLSSGSKGAKGMVGSTLLDLSNALLELPEGDIAAQITRIAWEAYSEMTPRDLMRHVLAPRDPRNPRTVLRDPNSAVMRSINFVNYLADWVASMILVQSKLKWRARLLEKFISIAVALRALENFDSLMGVLAGLNSQPIFRLTETMAAVSLVLEQDRTKMPKRLRSLNKLMSTTKSFSAYRLALANSGINMLPYLGVHLQDITVINEVKSDMRDGKVNWSKFSQMGRSAAIVLDCAKEDAQVFDRAVDRCILNVPLVDKDTQYALSYQCQPRAPANATGRTKLQSFVRNLASKD